MALTQLRGSMTITQVPFQTALELTMQLMKRKVTSTTGDKISVCFFGVSKTHGKECERNVRPEEGRTTITFPLVI